MKRYKIASRSIHDKNLVKKILSLKKPTIISLGFWNKKKLPFNRNKNQISYLYCVSKYPTRAKDLSFSKKLFRELDGFSDHTIGLSASLHAVSRGAEFIEKHYSNNKSMNVDTQLAHVCSMDQNDLAELRKYSDSINLVRNNH